MLKVETWPIEKLIPYARNPRKNDEQVDRMVSAIKEFGFRIPIVAKSDGSVVDGHLRLKAAQKLGMKEVPVALADELTDAQVKAFRLLANKSANWAQWDDDLLKLELTELQDMAYDLELTGFDIAEIDTLIAAQEEGTEGQTDPDEVPEVQEEPVTQAGDIWLLGKHRLMCGDCSILTDVETLVKEKKAAMVFTDPPYGVSVGDKNKMLNKFQPSNRVCENIANDTLKKEDLYEFLKTAFSNAKINCKDDASYYVTVSLGCGLGAMMMMMMNDAGLDVRHVLMWEKNSPTFSMGRLDYDYKHEPILYTWDKSHKFYGKGEQKTSVWKYDKPRKCDLHPTMKPVELIENAILNSSLHGEVVLDIFGGSGSTLIACEKTGRVCRMMELSSHYCDVIVKRWQDFTGQQATLEVDGRTFDEVCDVRH